MLNNNKYRASDEEGRDDGFTYIKDTNRISERGSGKGKSGKTKSGSDKEPAKIATLYELETGRFYTENISKGDGYRDYMSALVRWSIQQSDQIEKWVRELGLTDIQRQALEKIEAL